MNKAANARARTPMHGLGPRPSRMRVRVQWTKTRTHERDPVRVGVDARLRVIVQAVRRAGLQARQRRALVAVEAVGGESVPVWRSCT